MFFLRFQVSSDLDASSIHSNDNEEAQNHHELIKGDVCQVEQESESKKAVSFMTTTTQHHQVEDTPLIFSRSSSFESLNSFVQHPCQGSEYSSYQCSRVTSGRVSPSDLPDSPIQTRPQTPKVFIYPDS